MSVTLKSGASTDIATVDATSKAVRVTPYTSAGVEVSPLADGGAVNLTKVGGTNVATGAGANSAGVQRTTLATDDALHTEVGGLTETAPASDTASSGLNGRLQRIAQRLTSLIALLPATIGAKAAAGSLSVTTATDDPELTLLGGVTESAPASDTASSGLNGRLQRIAQRLTSLIALFPASIGQKNTAGSLSVTLSSDHGALPTGSNIIGRTGIDQTTPGTTNAVSATNFPGTVSVGTGAQGASSPRVTVAVDSATVAGSAPGTAGTPSTNVVTVQGIASGTAIPVSNSTLPQPTLPSSIVNGRITVTTSGTRVAGTSQALVVGAFIRALDTNTGIVVVGSSTVTLANGHRLSPGESTAFNGNNLNLLNVDAAVNGEGVSYFGN